MMLTKFSCNILKPGHDYGSRPPLYTRACVAFGISPPRPLSSEAQGQRRRRVSERALSAAATAASIPSFLIQWRNLIRHFPSRVRAGALTTEDVCIPFLSLQQIGSYSQGRAELHAFRHYYLAEDTRKPGINYVSMKLRHTLSAFVWTSYLEDSVSLSPVHI